MLSLVVIMFVTLFGYIATILYESVKCYKGQSLFVTGLVPEHYIG